MFTYLHSGTEHPTQVKIWDIFTNRTGRQFKAAGDVVFGFKWMGISFFKLALWSILITKISEISAYLGKGREVGAVITDLSCKEQPVRKERKNYNLQPRNTY